MKNLIAAFVLWCLMTVAAQAQIQTTRIVINQPANPSGAGWVPITHRYLLNGQGGPFPPTPTGQYQFFMVGGSASQIWLTNSAGYGSLHTVNVSGAYDTIVIEVQGPVTTAGVRPFIQYRWKGNKVTVSPVTYLPHVQATFPY